METFSFEEGARIILDHKRFRLLNEVTIDGLPCWQMVPVVAAPLEGPTSGAIVDHHLEADLHAWLANGRLQFDDERDNDTPETREKRRHQHATPISDKKESVRKRIAFRRDIIHEIAKRLPPGLKTTAVFVDGHKTKDTVLNRTLKQLGRELGQKHYGKAKNVSPAAYYRWKKTLDLANDARDLEGDFNRRGNRKKILKLVKDTVREVISEKLKAATKRRPGGKPTATMAAILDESLLRINKLKETHPEFEDKISLPCKSTFYNILNTFPAYLRSLAGHGPTQTRHDFRRPFGHEEPEACLSQLQYDETRTDLYCFDDVLGIPLGRAWLAWLVDVFSGAIVGFYCGFEPPGDIVFGSVMRHACLPKAYVGQVYPDISGNYPMGGFPRHITFDNSLSAHGRTNERLLGDLDITYDFTGPRMPWLKGDVEGTFKSLNQAVLSEMPGFVLSDKIDRSDYDPSENGAIGFLHLLWIVHKYLVEVRHTHAPPGFGATPNQLWIDGTRIIKPRFPRTSTDLDFLFGIDREGSLLDHRGVLYEKLRYYSNGVDILRRRLGASIKVRVRVNPLNLAKIHVYDKDENIWIPCNALDYSYANGLDLHRHKLYLRHAERLSGSTNLEARIGARASLHDLIRKGLPDAMGLRNNALIARAAGIGTHSIFNLLDHQGHINLLAQNFATGCVANLAASPTLQPQADISPSESVATENITPNTITQPSCESKPEIAQPPRTVPVFAVDKSLRHS